MLPSSQFSLVCTLCRTQREITARPPNRCCVTHSSVVHNNSIKRDGDVIVDMQPLSAEEIRRWVKQLSTT